jgi:beta-glucanase (GH16 family)
MRLPPGGSARRWSIVVLALVGAVVVWLSVLAANDTPYAFVDDFTGPSGSPPDPRLWSFDIGDGGWGNNELQVYTDSRMNSFLDGDGHLVLRASSHFDSTGRQVYDSARLKTQGKFAQRQGHWEARIKVNSTGGFWPAWWMLGSNIATVGWPACGEIDMLEDFGYSTVASSVHTRDGSGKLRSSSASTPNDDKFHVFRLDWSENRMVFSRDGQQYGAVKFAADGTETPAQPNSTMFMLLNVAVGGNAGRPSAGGPTQAEMVIDYVRVWI